MQRKYSTTGYADYYYSSVHTVHNGKASECIRWKREKVCPQHLAIRELLKEVAGEFEKGQPQE